MAKRLTTGLLACAVALVLVIGAVEFRHRVIYGHFVPPTLHVDVTAKSVMNGAQKARFHKAQLTNFSLIPHKVEQCEFTPVTSSPRRTIRYSLERWDSSSSQWRTVVHGGCYGNLQPVSGWLWPGQTVSTPEEVAAAYAEQRGDTMRLTALVDGNTIPGQSFTVDDFISPNGNDLAASQRLESELNELTVSGASIEDVKFGLQVRGMHFDEWGKQGWSGVNPTLTVGAEEKGLAFYRRVPVDGKCIALLTTYVVFSSQRRLTRKATSSLVTCL